MFKKLFKKIAKGIKKVAKKIVKVQKKVWKGIKKVGGKVMKAINKAGIVGQLGLMLVMPYAMSGLGSLVGNAAGGLSATWNGFGNWAGNMMGKSNVFFRSRSSWATCPAPGPWEPKNSEFSRNRLRQTRHRIVSGKARHRHSWDVDETTAESRACGAGAGA